MKEFLVTGDLLRMSIILILGIIILLISIVVITVSGIIISTWLTISYEIYPLIRDIHIIPSIAGLALLILKLAYHWKFFTSQKLPLYQ